MFFLIYYTLLYALFENIALRIAELDCDYENQSIDGNLLFLKFFFAKELFYFPFIWLDFEMAWIKFLVFDWL